MRARDWHLAPVQRVVQPHLTSIIKRLDRRVAARLAPPTSWASHHSEQVRGIFKLTQPSRRSRSLFSLSSGFLPMDGLQRGNSRFALFGLGASAPSAMELAFHGFAGFQCRPTTLNPRAPTLGSAAQTVNFPTCYEKIWSH